MKYLIAFAVSVASLLGLSLVSVEAGPACSTPVVQRQFVQSVTQAQVQAQAQIVAPVVAVQNVVVAQFVAVPVAVPTYAVGYDPQAYGITEELRLIREELRRTREALTAPGGVQPDVLPNVDPMEKVPPPAQASDPPHVQILKHHCAACHTHPNAKGGVAIFASPGQLASNVNKFSLWDAAESKVMPPDPKPKVHPDDVKILRDWARAR